MGRPQHFTIDYSHPLARGLVFAGLGNAAGSVRYHDSSSKKNNGTLTNMSPANDWTWVPELGRWSIDLTTASTEYVAASLTVPIPYTLALWVRWSAQPYTYVLSSEDATNCAMFVNSTNIASYVSNDYKQVSKTTATNVWEHLAIQRSATQIKFFVNGTQIGSTLTPSNSNAAVTTRIGNRSDAGRRLNGMFSDVLMHTRFLSDAELKAEADPSNYMLSGMIKPIGQSHNIYNLEGVR